MFSRRKLRCEKWVFPWIISNIAKKYSTARKYSTAHDSTEDFVEITKGVENKFKFSWKKKKKKHELHIKWNFILPDSPPKMLKKILQNEFLNTVVLDKQFVTFV